MTTTEELRAKKRAKELEISQVASRIEGRLERYADWRYSVQESPILSVAMATGFGMLASGVALPIVLLAAKQAGKMMQSGMAACLVNLLSQGIRRAIRP